MYQHFGDKERLVTEVVLAVVTGAGAPVDDEVHRLAASTDLARDLRDHGRRQLHAVLQPRPMQLRRLVIAEAVTFPALGAALYEHGPGGQSRSWPMRSPNSNNADSYGPSTREGLRRTSTGCSCQNHSTAP